MDIMMIKNDIQICNYICALPQLTHCNTLNHDSHAGKVQLMSLPDHFLSFLYYQCP